MTALPSLDAHAHLDMRRHPAPYEECGAVLAQTMSLAEAERTSARTDAMVAFGVGCHPRLPAAHAGFDRELFEGLVARSPLVGEVGLDSGSRVPVDAQLTTFRTVLEVVAARPRIVSLHAFRSTRAMLDELTRTPIVAPILHWWTGSAAETSEAVALGCSFSVHAAVARQSKWHTRVPLDRILVESDHGWSDPPAAIPLRVGWVEHLLAQQYRIAPEELRAVTWRNLGRIVEEAGVVALLPPGIRRALPRPQAVSA